MNCQAYKDLLFNYIDGHIEDRQKRALRDHLKDCRSCREEEHTLRTLQQRLIVHGQAIAETDLATGVLDAIMRKQKKRLLENKSITQAGRSSIMKSPIFK
jgi:anti-sigma factor RsiW